MGKDPIVYAALEGYKLGCEVLATLCELTDDKNCKELVSSLLTRARQARQYLAHFGFAQFLTFYASKAADGVTKIAKSQVSVTGVWEASLNEVLGTSGQRLYNILVRALCSLKGSSDKKADEKASLYRNLGYFIYLVSFLRAYNELVKQSVATSASSVSSTTNNLVDYIRELMKNYAIGKARLGYGMLDTLVEILGRLYEIVLTPLEEAHCVKLQVESLCWEVDSNA